MRIHVIALTFVLVACSSEQTNNGPSGFDVSGATVAKIQSAVIPIICVPHGAKPGDIPRIIGTGFFVNTDGNVVTARHLVLDTLKAVKEGRCVQIVAVASHSGWQFVKDGNKSDLGAQTILITGCRTLRRADIGYCMTNPNPFLHRKAKDKLSAVTFDDIWPPSGEPIAFTGFPIGSLFPQTGLGVVDFYGNMEWCPNVVFLKAQSFFGFSGGPVYNSSGRVIGIVNAGNPNGETMSCTADIILRMLRQSDIKAEGGD